MNDHADSVSVELVLNGFKINGKLHVEERRRLVDILNTADEIFDLSEVTVTPTSGEPRSFKTLPIEKRSILMAIPQETEEQSRRRAVLSTGLARSTASKTPLWLLVPPLIAEGMVHIGFATGKIRSLDSHSIPRFFALTNAKVYLEDRRTPARRTNAHHRPPEEFDVLFMNRDLVAAVALLNDQSEAKSRLAAFA
jgi:hypothetical protein